MRHSLIAFTVVPAVSAAALLASAGPAGAAFPGLPAPTLASRPGPAVWTRLHPAVSPSRRADAMMAWDPATHQLILFGGGQCLPGGGCQVTSDIWTWARPGWKRLRPAASPPARTEGSLAYDPKTGQLVLFGGYDAAQANLSDTWAWTGTTWRREHPAAHPPAMHDTALGYDPASRTLILFGGSTQFSGSPLNSGTWAWTGTTWIRTKPAARPPAVSAAVLAEDPATGQLILFGGDTSSSFTASDQTWQWTGTTWHQLHPRRSPPARFRASLAYDPATRSLILFSGYGPGLANLDDTWSWTGTTWTRLSPATSPSARADAALGYYAPGRELILFAGSPDNGTTLLHDTWSFR
jgi:hypothetical protein